MTLPDPIFVGWFAWTAVRDRQVLSHDAAFDEVGTYLLARFPGGPPSDVDATDERIFYVGETHGRTRTLRLRLTDFGKSAGFFGRQDKGHYAAWDFPNEFPEDVIDREQGHTNPSNVYVALCPFPGGNLNRATRGVFPGLVEAQVLWHYTNRHGRLPQLNNSGRQERAIPAVPQLDSERIRAILSSDQPAAAAEQLLTAFASALGYSPNRPISRWRMDGWEGVERRLSGRWRLSIGWYSESRDVGMWLSDGNEEWFGTGDDEKPASTESSLLALFERFWKRWHSE